MRPHVCGIGHDVQQRCLAMLVFITSLWVTEAVPYFATALLVPPMVVFLQILNDKAHPDTLLTPSMGTEQSAMLWNASTILIAMMCVCVCVEQSKRRKR